MSTPSGSVFMLEHVARGAIALNNMAVLMSERQQYALAHDTLKDAAQLMKLVTLNELPESVDQETASMLHAAHQRLSSHRVANDGCTVCPLVERRFAFSPIRIEQIDSELNLSDSSLDTIVLLS